MTSELRANRTLVWLGRGTLPVLIALFVVLQIFGDNSVVSTRDGDKTIYAESPLIPVIIGVFGVVLCVMGFLYWMTRRRFFSFLGIGCFLLAIFAFFFVPTLLNHCVIVTPDDFYHRIGAWYAPEEAKVSFDSLKYMVVNLKETDRSGNRNYELLCVTREGDETIRIPVHVLMNKALREILERAAQRGVFIDENEEGWQIPPDISQ